MAFTLQERILLWHFQAPQILWVGRTLRSPNSTQHLLCPYQPAVMEPFLTPRICIYLLFSGEKLTCRGVFPLRVSSVAFNL